MHGACLHSKNFQKKFEAVPVSGVSSSILNKEEKSINWDKSADGGSLMFGWPKGREKLAVTHKGTGKPWATLQSIAAIPLKEPFSSGYKIKKTLIPHRAEAGRQMEQGRRNKGSS